MMTKEVLDIWVVMHCYWEDSENLAVFDTEAAAAECADRPNLHYSGPFQVNAPPRTLPKM